MMDALSFRKNSAIIPLICLFIYAAVIPMQLSNYVLCIGEDGHVKFQFAGHGCCKDVHSHDHHHQHHHHAETDHTADDDHCSECLDLSIFVSLNSCLYLVSCENNPVVGNDIPSAIQMTHKSTVPADASISLFSVIPPLIDPVLISLRTVTLLL